MSASKPVAKRPRVMNPQVSPVTRTESVDLSASTVEGKDLHIATTPVPEGAMKAPAKTHPKGHKVRKISEIWQMMDASNPYLRLTDTLALNDVWVQPVSCVPAKGTFVSVAFIEIVNAPHIRFRNCEHQMSTDDLLKILYLNECVQWDMQEEEHIAYDKWFDSKCAACIKEKGADEGCKQSTICNFILTEDPEFPTFYPALLKSRFGMFFRKSCIHTYQNDVDEVKEKLINPSMVKNCAIKGTFEYVWEARLILLPDKWFSTSQASFVKMDDGEMPESQAI